MDLAFEDEDHVLGFGAFFEEDVSGLCDELLTVAGKPEPFFERKAMEGTDAFEGLGDLLWRRGMGGGLESEGEHEASEGGNRIADGWGRQGKLRQPGLRACGAVI
jgi:hypothetical protein